MQRFGQFSGGDIPAGFEIEDLLRFAFFVADNSAIDRFDLKRRVLRRNESFLFDRVVRFRATLCGVESLIDRDPHPILAARQDDGRASDKSLTIVQAVNDGEVRRRIVRREDIRSADHRERRVFLEFAGLDRVGQLNGSDDALDARLFGILGKNDALDLRAEWRRGRFILEPIHQDLRWEKRLCRK